MELKKGNQVNMFGVTMVVHCIFMEGTTPMAYLRLCQASNCDGPDGPTPTTWIVPTIRIRNQGWIVE